MWHKIVALIPDSAIARSRFALLASVAIIIMMIYLFGLLLSSADIELPPNTKDSKYYRDRIPSAGRVSIEIITDGCTTVEPHDKIYTKKVRKFPYWRDVFSKDGGGMQIIVGYHRNSVGRRCIDESLSGEGVVSKGIDKRKEQEELDKRTLERNCGGTPEPLILKVVNKAYNMKRCIGYMRVPVSRTDGAPVKFISRGMTIYWKEGVSAQKFMDDHYDFFHTESGKTTVKLTGGSQTVTVHYKYTKNTY